MFVTHRHVDNQLGAGLVNRAYICATVPPGSTMWNNWSCGPVPGATAAPAPPPAAAASAPAPSAVPSISVDPELARQRQAEYDARIAAEIAAAAAGGKAAEERAAERPTELSDQVLNPGAFGASTFNLAPGSSKTAAPVSVSAAASAGGGSGLLLMLLAAGGVAALAMRRKRR